MLRGRRVRRGVFGISSGDGGFLLQDAVDRGDLGGGGARAVTPDQGEGAFKGCDVPSLGGKWGHAGDGLLLALGPGEKLAEVGVVAAVEKLLNAAQGHAAGLQGADRGKLEEVALAVGTPLARGRSVKEAEGAVIAQAALGEVLGGLAADGNEAAFGAPVVHGFREILKAGERRGLRAEFEA